jgi:hypothetical protein
MDDEVREASQAKRVRRGSHGEDASKDGHVLELQDELDLEQCSPEVETEEERQRRFPAVRGNWPVLVHIKGGSHLGVTFLFFGLFVGPISKSTLPCLLTPHSTR